MFVLAIMIFKMVVSGCSFSGLTNSGVGFFVILVTSVQNDSRRYFGTECWRKLYDVFPDFLS